MAYRLKAMHHADPPRWLRELLTELKRRRVFRVASFYLVAAWAVIETSSTILPALNLPGRYVTFVVVAAIIGFPVTIVLSWIFDITEEGLVWARRPSDEQSSRRRVAHARWLKPLITVVAVLVVIGGAWTAASIIRRKSTPPQNLSIAIFPFQVEGSPTLAYLRDGMVSLLSTSLNGAGDVHVIDPTAVIHALRHPKRDVGVQEARRIASQFSATYFVLGSLTETDAGVLLHGRLYQVGKEEPLTTIAIPGTRTDVPGLVDHFSQVLLSDQLRREGMHLASTAALTTSSMPALKAYLTGVSEYRSSQWKPAMSELHQAVTLDTAFALAYYRLATAAFWAASFDTMNVAADRAFQMRGRLSRHDQELVEAFHAWTRGEAAPAERLYSDLTKAYPADAEAWYFLGEVRFHYGPVRGKSFLEAKTPFLHALADAPDEEPILNHLMEIALYQRDDAAFDSLTARAALKGPALLRRTAAHALEEEDSAQATRTLHDLRSSWGGDVFVVAANLATFARDLDMAHRVARLLTMRTREAPIRGAGYLMLAQIAAGRGRWADASADLDTLGTIHGPTALVYRALYASVPLLHLDSAELRSIRSDLERWKLGPSDDIDAAGAFLGIHNGAWPLLRLYTLGLVNTRLGDDQAAERDAQRLDRWAAQDSLPAKKRHFASRLAHGIRMRLALADRSASPERVLFWPPVDVSLDQVANSSFYAEALQRYTRGLLLRRAQKPDSAAQWLKVSMQGRNDLFLLGPATLQLARTYADLGEDARAAAAYSSFLRLWKDADPQCRGALAEARASLSRLESGS